MTAFSNFGHRQKFVLAIFSGAILASCSNSNFSGNGSKSPSGGGKPASNNANPNIPIPSSGVVAVPTPTPSDGLQTNGGETVVNDPAKCWFAVSGAYFGLKGGTPGDGAYHATFPLTQTGAPISHGAKFDDAGGVFLAASDTPYIYHQGGHEIDLAIDSSFDSIAVAPGMTVEIKDANGVVLYTGSGPFMAYSSDWGTNELGGNMNFMISYLQSWSSKMPAWMVTYLTAKNYTLDRIPLWAGRSVKVSKIPNVPCQ